MLSAADDAIDRSGGAAHHHQLGSSHSQTVIHSHLRPGHMALLGQIDHLGVIDKAHDLRAMTAQQPGVDVVGQKHGIRDDRAAHFDQPANVSHRRWPKIHALGKHRILGLFLDPFQDIGYVWIHIWGTIAMPAIQPRRSFKQFRHSIQYDLCYTHSFSALHFYYTTTMVFSQGT